MENKSKSQKLSLIQCTAIKGEIASIVSLCKHKQDRAYSAFILVNIADSVKEHYNYYLNCVKEQIAEDVVNTCFLYKSTYTVPYHIWVDKFKQDIICSKQHKNIVRSKFMFFIRECMHANDVATRLLLTSFLEDYSFEYLHDLVTYSFMALDKVSENKNSFSNKILSLSEDKVYHLGSQIFSITYEKCEALSVQEELFSEEEQEHFIDEAISPYVVKKVLIESGRVVAEEVFSSEEEAEAYKHSIIQDYPELTKQFKFKVEKVKETR